MTEPSFAGVDLPADALRPIRSQPLGMEALGGRFQTVGAESAGGAVHTKPRGRALLNLLRRRLREYAVLRRQVLALGFGGTYAGGALEWLRDNDASIYETARDLSGYLPPGFHRELPQLRATPWARLPRVYRLAFELVAATDSALELAALDRAVDAYQQAAPLTIGELWALPTMLRIVLFDNLVRLMARTRQRTADGAWARAQAARLISQVCGNRAPRPQRAAELGASAGAVVAKRSPTACVEFLEALNAAETVPPPAAQAAREAMQAVVGADPRALAQQAHLEAAGDQVTVGSVVTSLRALSAVDWPGFFERHSVAEAMLRREPLGVYARQDFATRDAMRHAVEKLAKRHVLDERTVIDAALRRAETAVGPNVRTVGYWLTGDGRAAFDRSLGGGRTPIGSWLVPQRWRFPLYATAVTVVTALAIALALAGAGTSLGMTVLVGALLLLPASEIAVGVVHAVVVANVRPRPLPKMDFAGGLAEGAETLVVIPALLARPGAGPALAERLEIHFLANRDDRLWFALATDFADAADEHAPEDDELLDEARRAIARLNGEYATPDEPRFFLFHRRRLWNERQDRWMGWERKRGKLTELNRLLRGSQETTFVETTVPVERLPRPTFVLTLDADTQLPLGVARRLVGAAAHPLNLPIVDDAGRLVGGYVLLQPRVNVTLPAARRSHFAGLYAGSAGIDPYSVAASDVYQDLFDEGSFIGKGVYHLDAFERLTDRAFPDNAILSHDLIESCFARCGLVSDVQLLDDFPTNFYVFLKREHRWIRGDWQLLPWLGPRIPLAPERFNPAQPASAPESTQPAPYGALARWKMLDNLRRSLLSPAVVLLLLAGWLFLPGNTWLWTAFALSPWLVPTTVLLVRSGLTLFRLRPLPARAVDLTNTLATALFEIAVLPIRAASSLDAVVRTLWRLFVSKRNLLEWQTAAAAERGFRSTFANYLSNMALGPISAVVFAAPIAAARPEALPSAALPLFAWFVAPALAFGLGQSPRRLRLALSERERHAFLRIARRTWAFFEAHVGPQEHHLPPDNWQETTAEKIAPRTSPTNMGFYLLSAVSARDLGFAALSATVERLSATIGTLEILEKHEGHILNWFDTRTLAPLPPRYVSTVDSGNLFACLWTLEQSLLEWASASDDAELLWEGIAETVRLWAETRPNALGEDALAALRERNASKLRAALPTLPTNAEPDPTLDGLHRLLAETFAERAAARTACLPLARRVRALADAMNFGVLYRADRKLYAIGLNLAVGRLDNSHYDLLASEAALTSFLTVASGAAPREHWFQLGRPFVRSYGRTALVSWGGTMFEYLMPRLLLRVPVGTALDESHRSAVAVQRAFAARRGIPWGISESAYNAINNSGDYQYQAFGVPELSLKRSVDDVVLAPYATALAVDVDPQAVFENFKRLEALGALTQFGFVDAIDYTPARRGTNGAPGVVRTCMAHHQGMTLVALANVLTGNRSAARLAMNPRVRAAEPLLHERMPADPALLAFPPPAVAEEQQAAGAREASPVRRIATPYTAFPRSHLLGNGRLSCMVTNAGGGRLAWNDLLVTRWREDRTKDDWGAFLYVHDAASGRTFSATCQPLGLPADEEEIEFAADRVRFRRVFREIELRLEIAVAPDEDVEVRRLAIVNRTNRKRRVSATTYMELALATAAADRAHPAFQKLFVETAAAPEYRALLAHRRPRLHGEETPWYFHVAASDRVGDVQFEWETDRRRFLGRGRNSAAPAALSENLSGTVGYPLDPIFALRASVDLPPGGSWTVAFSTGVAPTWEAALTSVDRLDDLHNVDRVFELAWAHAQEARRRAPQSAVAAQLYQRVSAQVLYAGAAFRADRGVLAANRLDRKTLWRYAISGDLPIVLARVSQTDHAELVRELAEAAAFWRHRGLKVDLAVLDDSVGDYRDDTHRTFQRAVESGAGGDAAAVKMLRTDRMPAEEIAMLRAAARCEFVGGEGPLEDQTAARERSVQDRMLRPTRPPVYYRPKVAASETQVERLTFANAWGGFASDGQEYVVYPNGIAGRPPMPWTNVIANLAFGCLADDGGLGYSWAGNAQLNRLTTWSNDPITSTPPEIVYVKDDETGEIWSATPAPAPAADSRYEVRHGFGRTVYRGSASGLTHELEVFAAPDDPLKHLVLTVRNPEKRPRRISVAYYAELALGGAREHSVMHTVTELEPVSGALLARNAFDGDFAGGWTFANVEPRLRSFTCDRKEFLGRLGGERLPAGLRAPALSGSVGAGYDPCFALSVGVALAPGEDRRFSFVLGRADSREAAERLAARCRDSGVVDADRAAVVARWRALTGALQVRTPDRAFDLLVNGWLLHQVLSSRIWGRTGLYQSGGAFGFRDQLQDAMALAISAPWELRAQLLRAASRQFEEGDVQHWWHPPSGAGVRTRITDDLVWLPAAVVQYVEAVGDDGVLDELAPYLTQPPLAPEQEDDYRIPEIGGSGSIYDHCVRALRCAAERDSPRGLPLIGTGDWNDGMNRVGAAMRGESVWNAWFQARTLDDFARLAEPRDADFAEWCRVRADKLRAACETYAWDGGWYLRATFDDGMPLGAAGAEECEIDVLPQAWAAIAGGNPQRSRQAVDAAKARLVNERQRLIKLFAPPFANGAAQPGYIKSYAPGIRENGGQYTHGAVWLAWAETVLGDGGEAKRLFDLLNPILRRGPALARYGAEPYVMPGDVYGAAPYEGRAGWTWYTGSAAWMLRLAVERILGLRRQGDRMVVAPCLPPDWPGYEATLVLGKSRYEVSVERGGDAGLSFDGARQPDNLIPYVDDGADHRVVVRLPSSASHKASSNGHAAAESVSHRHEAAEKKT